MRWLVAAAAVVAAGSFGIHAAAGPPPEEIAFLSDDGSGPVVPVILDGAGPFRFLLDTGSTRSAVSDELARRLAFPLVARTEMVTAAGAAIRGVVRLGRVSLGSHEVAGGLPAAMVPSDELRVLGRGIDGILAQDFLSRFNYTLDYRRRRLIWDEEDDERAGECPGNNRHALRWKEGRFLVELPQGESSPMLVLVPDSAAGGLVLFERPGGVPIRLRPGAGRVDVVTMTGRRQAAAMRLDALRVGGTTLRDQPVVVVQRPDADAPEGDGLLPLDLFARVSFRSASRMLIVEP